MMFFISIEPVYSQGVGSFHLLTESIENAEKFRLELFNFKNNLLRNSSTLKESLNKLRGWEFYEYVYKITEIKKENDIFNVYGFLILKKCYIGNFKKLNKINWKRKRSQDVKIIYKDDNIDVNIVYNTMSTDIKPCHINDFLLL